MDNALKFNYTKARVFGLCLKAPELFIEREHENDLADLLEEFPKILFQLSTY